MQLYADGIIQLTALTDPALPDNVVYLYNVLFSNTFVVGIQQ